MGKQQWKRHIAKIKAALVGTLLRQKACKLAQITSFEEKNLLLEKTLIWEHKWASIAKAIASVAHAHVHVLEAMTTLMEKLPWQRH